MMWDTAEDRFQPSDVLTASWKATGHPSFLSEKERTDVVSAAGNGVIKQPSKKKIEN